MGLLRKVQGWHRRWRNSRSHTTRSAVSSGLRICRFEEMEPRQYLSATPIQVGAVYYENHDQNDTSGDTIQITFNGGASGTQLSQVVIDTDKYSDGLTIGDVFFDTAAGGAGAFGSGAFTIVDKTGIDSVKATVVDGGTRLVLDFTGFDAGEKFVFTIDVDEQGFLGANAIAEGNEFEGSRMTANFTAPHYYAASGTDMFIDYFDQKLQGSGLNLPPDDYDSQQATAEAVYTAGAIYQLEQTPLPIKISGNVYEDLDLDNQRDSGESGIAGVNLTLFRWENNQYVSTGKTAVTDASGHYEFDDVLPGTYRVAETQPTGYFSIGATAGTVSGSTRGVVTGVNEISTIDLLGGDESVNNDFAEAKPATLSGHVYHDANNNGILDAGETGIAGATLTIKYLPASGSATTIQVVTDANGFWSATNLMPGNYQIDEIQPAGYLDGLDAAGTAGGTAINPGDRMTGIHLGSGQAGTQYNFGELLPSTISGQVIVDANGNGLHDASEAPLAGVTVYLLDGSGNRIANTVTDSNGYYAFTGLAPGIYGVEEAQPNGYYDGADLVGSAGGTLKAPDSIVNVTLTSGTQGVHYDFLELLPSSIRGRVVADTNGNGQYDDGDVLLPGVTVYLLDSSGNRIANTVTDENGEYEFVNLAPGQYGVEEAQPSGYFDGSDSVGTAGGVLKAPDSIVNIRLVSGTAGQHYDFYELVPVSLSGFVYVDDNNNGQRNAGEAGIAGVTLTLLDGNGNSTGITTVTDANGYYEFDGLRPGAIYGVAETQPSGYLDGLDTAGTAGGTAQNPGDKITGADLGYGTQAKNYNFGELRPASIAGEVFVDKDDDGLIDSGEGGIAGVTVWLLDGSGQRVRSTTTDSTGHYAFTNLQPGTYGVEEVQPANYFDGKDHLGTAGGALTNDRVTQIVLGSGVSGTEYNFGEMVPAKISGYVFQDGPTVTYKEGDPVPDPLEGHTGVLTSDDKRLAGVVLHLGDATGAPVVDAQGHAITAVTDANGYYEFTNLRPGVYTILEAQPNGYVDGIDTAGSKGGIAVNRDSVIDPEVLGQLAVDPKNDAILRIVINGGDTAVQYNFSEVKLEEIPDTPPPYVPPTPKPPAPKEKPALPGDYQVVPVVHYEAVNTAKSTAFLGSGGINATYTWHLSVIDAGQPRNDRGGTDLASDVENPLFNPVSWTGAAMNHAQWVIADAQGKVTNQFLFGLEGGTPVTGDFNGDGVSEVAIFFDGVWFIDLNGNGVWDEGDLWVRLGKAGDQPITGDWDGDGKTDIGVFGTVWQGDGRAIQAEPGLPDANNHRTGRPKNVPPKPEQATSGHRTLKRTAKGSMRSDVIDHVFQYGSEGDRAVTGDWTGNGVTKIGVFRHGTWYLDMDGDGRWSQADLMVHMGNAGDIPVVGDWTGDGKTKLGLYRDGTFQLDINNDHKIDANDHVFQLGGPNDKPVAGDFNGDGIDEVAVYQETFTKPNEQAATETETPHVATAPKAAVK